MYRDPTDNMLPCRLYLRHCVLAAQSLGPVAHENFLDNSFLVSTATLLLCSMILIWLLFETLYMAMIILIRFIITEMRMRRLGEFTSQ